MSPRTRRSDRQIAAVSSRLSERDLVVLQRIAQLKFLRTDQIRDLVFVGHANAETAIRVCRRTLKRLVELDLIRRLDRRIGGMRSGSAGSVFVLTSGGHRTLNTGVKAVRHEPGLRHLAHTLMGNDLAIQIEVASRQSNFEILNLQHEPDCWRPLAAGRQLKPDVFAHVANEEFEAAWFIEIDCGTESGTTIVGKCDAYLDYRRTRHAQEQLGFFPRIIFVTPESERARRLHDVLASQDLPAGLFTVAPMSEAIEVITNLDDP